MYRKLCFALIAGFFLISLAGCLVVAAGAGGAGTAGWLSNKLTQQVDASYQRAQRATESALKSLGLPLKKKTIEEKISQFISETPSGKTIWIDVHKVAENSSRIEVRVGAVQPDKEEADKILKKIVRYL